LTAVANQAEALLRLTVADRARAATHVAGYDIVSKHLGPCVAAWAYADRGTEPGQRDRSHSEGVIKAWDSRPQDWACVVSQRTGAGKTIAAARYVGDRGGTILRAAEADGWGFNALPQIGRYAAADLLLVDDIGLEETSTGRGHIAAIFTLRAARWARTLATTTLLITGKTGSILALYGEPIESRLRGHFHNLSKYPEPDRRSLVRPVLTGFSREEELDYVARSVRYTAAGLVAEDLAAVDVARFAVLARVDMASESFQAMVTTVERERDERASAAAEMLAMFGGRGVIELDAGRSDHGDELLGWVDSYGEAEAMT
jgi:hypothetical protein